MPITRADVSTDVTNKITSKTAEGSLLNTEDGANRELILDYIDQEVIVKTVKVNVSQAEIATLHTTGKTLINNTDATKKIFPLSYYFVRQDGAVYTSSFNIFYILNENNNTLQTIDHPFLANISGFMMVNASTDVHNNMTDIFTQIILKGAEAFTSGTNGFNVYLTYAKITL